jgi:hypothetical protein
VYKRSDRVGATAYPTGYLYRTAMNTFRSWRRRRAVRRRQARGTAPRPGAVGERVGGRRLKASIPSLYVVCTGSETIPLLPQPAQDLISDYTSEQAIENGEVNYSAGGTRCNASHRDARGVPCPRPDPPRERVEGDGGHRDPRIRVPGRGYRPPVSSVGSRSSAPCRTERSRSAARGDRQPHAGSSALRTNAWTSRLRMRSD